MCLHCVVVSLLFCQKVSENNFFVSPQSPIQCKYSKLNVYLFYFLVRSFKTASKHGDESGWKCYVEL
jgi:hypothetical protein